MTPEQREATRKLAASLSEGTCSLCNSIVMCNRCLLSRALLDAEAEVASLRAQVAGLKESNEEAARVLAGFVPEPESYTGHLNSMTIGAAVFVEDLQAQVAAMAEWAAKFVACRDVIDFLNLQGEVESTLPADLIARGRELLEADDLLSAIERRSGPIGSIEPPEAFPDRKWTVWDDGGDGHLGRGDTLREALINTLKRLKGDSNA